jgi:hypothetical protein
VPGKYIFVKAKQAFVKPAAFGKLGSKRTCGGAAAGSQRFRSSSQPLDDRSESKVAGSKQG